MKLVVQVKLLPTAEQAAALWSTLHACNEAADEVSRVAFETGVFREYALRKPTRTRRCTRPSVTAISVRWVAGVG